MNVQKRKGRGNPVEMKRGEDEDEEQERKEKKERRGERPFFIYILFFSLDQVVSERVSE